MRKTSQGKESEKVKKGIKVTTSCSIAVSPSCSRGHWSSLSRMGPPPPNPHAMSAPASLPSFDELHLPRGMLRHSLPRATVVHPRSTICLFVTRRFNSELSFCFSFRIGARYFFASSVTTLSATFAVSFTPWSLEDCPVAMPGVTVQGHSRPRISCVGAPACSNHIVNSE